jgi:hypothetical protein
MVKQLFSAAVLTYLIGILVYLAESQIDLRYLPFALIIIPFTFVLPNFIVLAALFYTKILKGKLTGTSFLVIEILLLYGINYGVNAVIKALPMHIKFVKTPHMEGIRTCFSDGFKFLYTYIILIIVLVLIRVAYDFYNKKRNKIEINPQS